MASDPQLLYDSLQVVIASLPSIRSANENGGELVLARKLYDRGLALIGRFANAAGPDLRGALERTRLFVADNAHLSAEVAAINLARPASMPLSPKSLY